MSRTNRRVRSLLTSALLTIALPAVNAQDPVSAPPTAAATSPPAGQDKPAAQPGSSTKPRTPVCFKLTMHCVDGTASPSTKGGAATQGTAAPKRPLNLAAPDIRTVVSPDELKEPLPSNEQEVQVQEADTVQVKGDQGVPPDVPGGFGALWWALNHPSQAWRILAPAE